MKIVIGHALIWCLYCDWMTGVWSLGTEMLRNVESFWYPIPASRARSAQGEIDFPDVNQGWVHASGNMSDVVRTLDRLYFPGAASSALVRSSTKEGTLVDFSWKTSRRTRSSKSLLVLTLLLAVSYPERWPFESDLGPSLSAMHYD